MSKDHRTLIQATVTQCELNTRRQRQYLKKYWLVKDLMKDVNANIHQIKELLQDELIVSCIIFKLLEAKEK